MLYWGVPEGTESRAERGLILALRFRLSDQLKYIMSSDLTAMLRSHVHPRKILSAALCAALFLAGCGTKAAEDTVYEQPSAAADPVSLSVYTWDDELPYMEDAVDAYNALNLNVEVEIHLLSNDDYEEHLAAALTDDALQVDLFGAKSLSSILSLDGQALDITDFILEETSSGLLDLSSYGSMIDIISYKDRYYSLPTRTTCWVLYYNRDLFDAAGLDYPDQLTWEEYADLALQLTAVADGKQIYGGYWVPWVPNFLAIQHESYLTDDSLSYAGKSLELLNQLFNVDQSHVSYSEMLSSGDLNNDYYQRFEAGTIAMMPQGEWVVNILIEDETDVNWGIAPMPVDTGVAEGTTWGQYQYMCISSACDRPEEAFDFLSFLCGYDGAMIYAQNGIIPAFMDNDVKEAYLSAVGNSTATTFFEAKRYSEQPSIIRYQEIQDAFYDEAQDYLLGDKTLDAALEDFDAKRREILAQ